MKNVGFIQSFKKGKIMNAPISTIIIIVATVVCAIYLVSNVMLQLRARHRLEKLLKLHESLLKQKFKAQEKAFGKDGDEVKYEILLMLLRQQIDELTDKIDKEIMQKTLDRKNYNNQKKYALKIFSESGLALF
jgi:hypothetical protein